MTDSELLVDYPGEQTESSFQALVERHLPLVYSSALRQLKHAALSEHVSHVTFLLLARHRIGGIGRLAEAAGRRWDRWYRLLQLRPGNALKASSGHRYP